MERLFGRVQYLANRKAKEMEPANARYSILHFCQSNTGILLDEPDRLETMPVIEWIYFIEMISLKTLKGNEHYNIVMKEENKELY